MGEPKVTAPAAHVKGGECATGTILLNLATVDPVIARLEIARTALAEATSLHQVKKIADVAQAAEVYARRQKLGEEAIGYAHAVKMEALTRLGELLQAMPKATGGKPYHAAALTCSSMERVGVSYASLHLDRRTAMVAQQLAGLPAASRQAIAARETTLTEARRQQRHQDRPAMTLPEGKYRVFYADPPWQYRDTRAGLGDFVDTAAEQHYPTMSVAELSALDVRSLAHDDAVLFCWATFPLLPDALEVVKAWGFTYKTAFVWHKPRGSFGHYHKADAELLLLATRGSCTPDTDRRESQILEGPVSGHSRKPEAAREIVDRLYGHGPRIELFARRAPDARWAVWGNEGCQPVACPVPVMAPPHRATLAP